MLIRRLKPIAGCLFALLLVAGCDSPRSAESSPEASAEPTPKERFENVVESLTRQVEDSQLTDATALASVDAPPGTPVTHAKTIVEHELIPPASEGEPYRAKIVLTTKSTVTVVLPPKDDAAAKAKDADANKLGDEIEGIPPLESLVVPSTGATSIGVGSPIRTLPAEKTRTYDFEYREGRWKLLTELDSENEPFNALAIEYALKQQ